MATPEQVAQFKLDNWKHALAVSKVTGIDPRIVMAQAAQESGWGTAAPGNNYFGMKGPGQTLATNEASGPTTASFRSYPDAANSFADYANNPAIRKVGAAGDYNAQIAALGSSGYATDPTYAQKVNAIAMSLQPPAGVEPSTLPDVQTGATGVAPKGGLLGQNYDPYQGGTEERTRSADANIADWASMGQGASDQLALNRVIGENAAAEKAAAAAAGDLTKQGTSLLAKSSIAAPSFEGAQASAHRPDVGGIAMPSYTPQAQGFQQMLMQQRLMRRR